MAPEIAIRIVVWYLAFFMAGFYIYLAVEAKDGTRADIFKIVIMLIALATSAKYLMG